MTEKQIEHGFWFWDRENDFPPKSIQLPSEYEGQSKVNIACTQILEITPTEQKRLVKDWIEFLPTCKDVEMLWFTTQTTQQLFDSVCKLENLIGLNIKWSNIKALENIVNLKNLKYLRIGSSSQIESIAPLNILTNLEALVIENFKKITDFSSLSALTNLKFLSIEGGMYTKQKVDTFEPISKLTSLIYFSTAMISCVDKRIDPILKLKNLITLNWAFDINKKDMERIKSELPNLKYLPRRYHEENMKKINSLKG
jgi:hypothetical protein